jgi:DNA uptake protein ComE-like DNA-binding protein
MKATSGYLGMAAACAVTMLVSGASAATDAPTRTSPQTATAAPAPPHPAIGAPTQAAGARSAAKGKAAPVKKVDINNASLAELKTLPTMGEAEAKKVIAHRPYRSKGELVTKAGLPEGVYHAVKRKVELQAPRKAVAKK